MGEWPAELREEDWLAGSVIRINGPANKMNRTDVCKTARLIHRARYDQDRYTHPNAVPPTDRGQGIDSDDATTSPSESN